MTEPEHRCLDCATMAEWDKASREFYAKQKTTELALAELTRLANESAEAYALELLRFQAASFGDWSKNEDL